MIGRLMKKLYIIRHAKSSWKDMSISDFYRPLNKRGKRNVSLMGSLLENRKLKADLILSSPALRAKITAETIAKKIEYYEEIVFMQEMYEASSHSLNEILLTLNKKYNTVFIFGHNTGFNDLAKKYVGLNENIPTCGVVEITFDCERWSEIGSSNAVLTSFDYPKKHI